MKRYTFLAVLLALLAAAPVIAHVVESAQFAFLSRDHMTIESPQMPFSTYTPGTLFFIR